MSEYQATVILFVYIVIVLSVAVSILLSRILRRLRNIERLLTPTAEQNASNKSEVSNSEGENE